MSSESRIWEIRPFGSMRGGSALVIGPGPFNPAAPAYSTEQRLDRSSVFSVISCWISRRRGIAQTWISFRVFRVFRGYISGRGRTAGRHGNFGQSRPEIFEIE